MAFAGLWESWRGPKEAPLAEPLLSFTFATTAPNAIVAPIHNRMPVLLSTPEEWDAWLSPDADPLALTDLLRPAPDDLLDTFLVTQELLKTKEPGPEVLRPVGGI
jgi:putative SOS response-associated peptidase YedK